ncbi:MAG: MFS transporter [Bdellovibrionota bacterium]
MAVKSQKPLLTIFLVVFFDLLAFGIVIPILPYYSKTFGATALELGWLMAAYSIAQFAFSPFWGGLSDRIGRRPVLLATILAGACSMTATALAPSYWMLFCARFAAGAFAANISTASAYIADITAPEDRAKGMGIIGASFGLGFIFGPAIGGIFSVYGYSVPILIAAALGLLNFFFAFFVLAESSEHREPAGKKFSLAGLQTALAEKITAIPIGLFFLNTIAFTQLEVVFGLFVLTRFGYGARNAGYLLAGIGIVSALLQGKFIGQLAKRWGEKNLLPVGFFFLAASLVVAAFAPHPTLFKLALFFLAIGNGLVNPSLSSLVSKGAPPSRRGTIMGIYQSAGSLSRVLGPPIAGFLFDYAGPASPLLLSSAIMAAALIGSLAGRKKLA